MIAFTKDQALARDLRDGSALDRMTAGLSRGDSPRYRELLKEVEIIEAAVRNASRPGCVDFKPSRNAFKESLYASDEKRLTDLVDENVQKFPQRILGRISLELEGDRPNTELIRALTDLYRELA